MKQRINIILALVAMMATPLVAHADLISVWVAGKYSGIQGTGNVFDSVDGSSAPGIEAGIELLNIDLMGEAYFLGNEQYMLTGNLGMDFSIDLGARLTVGGYLTAFIFKTPDVESQSFMIEGDLRSRIGESLANTIESAYEDEFSSQADELSQWAAGVGPRVRVQLDYALFPTFYIGVEGSAGYHYMLSGDDVASEGKSRAIDALIADEPMLEPFEGELKEAAGAKSVDTADLSGTNYQFGIYLKLDLGI